MTMTKWAEKEIEIACKKENPNRKPGEWDYGCACYKSALKAYKSMLNDNHSGYSWSITANILERLIHSLPLTPITESDFDGVDGDDYGDGVLHYQCPRMLSLFKEVNPDGTVEYTDVERVCCYLTNDPKVTFSGGGSYSLIDSRYPITLPYYPSKDKYIVEMDEFLYDKNCDGDYDTWAYLSIKTPDGTKVTLNDEYYRDLTKDEYYDFILNNPGVKPPHSVKITKEEFLSRKFQ